MLSELIKKIQESKTELCVQIEYYCVFNCVIKIWKSPILINKEKPLIEVHSEIETAPNKALLMLEKYLSLSEKEREKISSITLQIKANY